MGRKSGPGTPCKSCSEGIPEGAHWSSGYCSDECRKSGYRSARLRWERARNGILQERPCVECGNPIPESFNANNKTCSETCREAMIRRNLQKSGEVYRREVLGKVRATTCIGCGSSIPDSRYPNSRYCSSRCRETGATIRRRQERHRRDGRTGPALCHACGSDLGVDCRKDKIYCDWSCKNAMRRTRRFKVTHVTWSREEIYERDHGICYMCNRNVPFDEYQVEHLIPLSKGGADAPYNIAVSCRGCNSGKKDNITQLAIALRAKNMIDALSKASVGR